MITAGALYVIGAFMCWTAIGVIYEKMTGKPMDNDAGFLIAALWPVVWCVFMVYYAVCRILHLICKMEGEG